MGQGYENAVPVYAVADGLLTRRTDWPDAVAIQHDDPLRTGEKVWTFYGGMASGERDTSFVVRDFPLGSADLSVQRGQLLGYQGQRYGEAGSPIWVHLHFAVVPALSDGSFPTEVAGLTELPADQSPRAPPSARGSWVASTRPSRRCFTRRPAWPSESR